MEKISVVVHDDYLDKVINALHTANILHLVDVREKIKEVLPGKVGEEGRKCAEYELRLGKMLEVLSTDKRRRIGFIRSLISPPPLPVYKVKRREAKEILSEVEEVLGKLEKKCLDTEKKLVELSESLRVLEDQKDQVSKLEPLDFDMSWLGDSEYLMIRAGFTEEVSALRDLLKDTNVSLWSARVEEGHAILLVAHRRDKEIVDKAKKFFTLFDLQLTGTPTEVLKRIKKEGKELSDKSAKLRRGLTKLRNRWEKKILILLDELRIEKDRKEVVRRFGKTTHTSLLSGWVREKDKDKLRLLVNERAKGHAKCYFTKPQSGDPPVHMDNPKWARPFELLTKMFAPPKYDEIDPTVIIGPIFVIFFGLMLGDVVYGVVVLSCGLLLMRGIGKFNRGMHDMGILLSMTGISAMFFGVLQGSYLGDLLPRFFGVKPFACMKSTENPLFILLIALAAGLVHINLGLVLAAHQNYRKRAYGALVHEQLSWWLIQPPAFLLVFHIFGRFTLSTDCFYFVIAVLIVGLALLLKKKGPLGFFDLTGYIGNWLSYARLLALCLATAGIAMTVNILVELSPHIYSLLNLPISVVIIGLGCVLAGYGIKRKGIGGGLLKFGGACVVVVGVSGLIKLPFLFAALVMPIVFIGGHVFNCAIQSLGGFVHSLRLQYVEFFSQFYEGGGECFTPFGEHRKHTVVVKK